MFDAASILNKVMNALPAAVNDERQYVKSLSAALTLSVAADGVYEAGEFQQACDYISKDTVVVRHDMQEISLDYFRGYVKYIEEAMKANDHNFVMMRQELLNEVKKTPSEYNRTLRNVLTDLKRYVEVAAERKMIESMEAVL
jgi:hypothetical protein